MRGYPRHGLGPRDGDGKPVGGSALLVTNHELRLAFGRRWSAILLADAGNVLEMPGDFRFSRMRAAAGPGLGIATPAGPVRIYYAIPLGPGDDDPRVQVTFGPVF